MHFDAGAGRARASKLALGKLAQGGDGGGVLVGVELVVDAGDALAIGVRKVRGHDYCPLFLQTLCYWLGSIVIRRISKPMLNRNLGNCS